MTEEHLTTTYINPSGSLSALCGETAAKEMIAYFRQNVAVGVARFNCSPEEMWRTMLTTVGRGGNEAQILAATAAAQEAIDAGEVSITAFGGLRASTGDE